MMALDWPGDGAVFDLSPRVKLRVSGTDRVRFLNGQLTNDVRKASESNAIEGCVLNAKGKMEAHVFLRAGADYFFVDADADADVELRKSLQSRLERYIIADDVQIEDVTDRLSILHVLSSERPAATDCGIVSANRFAVGGWDIWATAKRHDEISDQLSKQVGFCDRDCAEVFRIEQGIPRWDRELTGEIIPIEANLEERCIDYEKGCYIGQETISRMKMSGQQNKKLCGLVPLLDSPLLAGMRLFPAAETSKEAGWITSAAQSLRLGKYIALGYVKRGFNSTGSKLDAIAPDAAAKRVPVEIVDLPFK
jgi:tRNA-modifying protein YgfZ